MKKPINANKNVIVINSTILYLINVKKAVICLSTIIIVMNNARMGFINNLKKVKNV